MEKKGLSQEALKIIACMTMLIDHIGATMVKGYWLRVIGRIAFPIYCFLLVEGAYYTKNPKKYALRLFIGMLLSELPFDLALKRGFTWQYQSVMVTLLIGFLAVEIIKNVKYDALKIAVTVGAYLLAKWAKTDYGGDGVLLIVLFSQCRGNLCMQTLVLLMASWIMNSLRIPIFSFKVPIEMFSVLAMIPIAFYSGKKATKSAAIQWVFYMFYPAHLLALFLIKTYVL